MGTQEHLRRIERFVQSPPDDGPGSDWRSASWSRCLENYRLDPSKPRIIELSSRETKDEIELFDNDIATAEAELEKALAVIQEGGYSAYIANRNGAIIRERRTQDETHYCSTDRVGMLWSENIGGTNGIGTSLITLEPTAVYLSDHFFADFAAQSCEAAPFFDADGNLCGVVNFSTRNPSLQVSTHKVVFAMAQHVAGRIETQFFRRRFGDHFILSMNTDEAGPTMLAVDKDQRVVGATRAARRVLSLTDSAIGSRTLWGIFERSKDFTSLHQHFARPVRLRKMESGQVFEAWSTQEWTTGAPVKSGVVRPARPPLPRGARAVTVEDCVGRDPVMRKNVYLLHKLMGKGLHFLLLGETGVGKDTLARALHQESTRREGPFVAFNCSAIPDSLIDSELFGYKSGAYTGANKDGAEGRILEANGGTLFLDEVGDMPLLLQTRLLRFLETGEVTPLGGGKTAYVDVQVIAATNQNITEQIERGAFRRDLFHRLAGAVVTLPPLRDRADKDHVITNLLGSVEDGSGKKLNDEARAAMLAYSWPGNIRELRTVLQRAAFLAEGSSITMDDLNVGGSISVALPTFSAAPMPPLQSDPTALPPADEGQAPAVSFVPAEATVPPGNARQARRAAEQAAMQMAIEQSRGDADQCASILGVSRATLYRKLKTHDLLLTDRARR